VVWLAGAAVAQGSPPAPAAEQSAEPEWEFYLAPYVWTAYLDGTVEAGGASTDFHVSFSDLLDVLDFGAMGAFEARRGRLSLTTNLMYLKVSDEVNGALGRSLPAAPPGSFEVRTSTKNAIVEFRPAWEVLSLPVFGEADPQRVALDLGPGARYWWFDNHLDVQLDPTVPLGPFKQRFDETTDWVDFLLAGRIRARLAEKVDFVVSGDYGGFDIGSSSHRTWSLAGFLGYQVGEEWALSAGWRTLNVERGAFDVTMQGPLVGVIRRF
jgi:hypothetical protein